MPFDIHSLTSRDYKVMPWKNGGGSTTELRIFPREAGLHLGFNWRISLADLEGSGAFSTFPGFERVIVQISGDAMTLNHKGKAAKRLTRYEPYNFAGEWQTENDLNGKAQDFNVMVRRDKYSAVVESQILENENYCRVHDCGTSFIWVACGSLTVHESAQGQDHKLDLHQSLEIAGEGQVVLSFKPREPGTVVLIVSISEKL